MMQPEFLIEALKACRAAGYHTAVDTSGQALQANFEAVIPFSNLFLFDLKHLDNSMHEKYTGVPNKLILSNLRLLVSRGKEIMIRIPVIPGVNDDKLHLENLRAFLTENMGGSLRKVSLLPYHKPVS